jgi:hypothetical protein
MVVNSQIHQSKKSVKTPRGTLDCGKALKKLTSFRSQWSSPEIIKQVSI